MEDKDRCSHCKICNKYYASYKSLWNHTNKFHLDKDTKCSLNVVKSDHMSSHSVVINQPNINCKFCNKIFQNRSNRWRHEKTCSKKDVENKKLELEIKKEETKILKLKLKLQNSSKIDNVTLRKLNKKLMERNNLINNSTVNSNNTTNIQNNKIINNFNLVGFGREEIAELLTMREKKLIMNSKYCSLEKLIEIIHCGKYNQFKNIILTNIKDSYMYKYDDTKGQFILSTKSDVLNSLINYRLDDLEVIYNDLIENNKLDEKTKDIIEKFINKINYSDSKYTDLDGREHDNYKQYKISEIKVLLYNNQDKITNDISLLLSTEETTKPNSIEEIV